MSVAISWANKKQLAKCAYMVGFPIFSHIWSKQDHVIVYQYGQDKNDDKLTEAGACHAAVGPPPQLVPGPSAANYVAIDGPPGPSMAAMDGPLGRKWSPTSKPV